MNEKIYKCRNCESIFTKRQSRYRHEKSCLRKTCQVLVVINVVKLIQEKTITRDTLFVVKVQVMDMCVKTVIRLLAN